MPRESIATKFCGSEENTRAIDRPEAQLTAHCGLGPWGVDSLFQVFFAELVCSFETEARNNKNVRVASSCNENDLGKAKIRRKQEESK